jgi:two-component system CheB/CheR fusion protein
VEGSQVAIHIKDSGIGIDPELLPRVFDLFTQADRSLDRSQGGLGIGLTLARSLVHLHGGELRAASAGLGQGSEFTVTLPRIIEHRSTPAADLPIETARSGPTSSRRILLVDDNTDLAAALSGLMRRQGHEVRIAHDGHQAIEVASTFLPELGLVDIGLPGMTGLEVAQRLRQLPGFDRVVLVAMTGYGQPEDRRRSAEAGFDHHLVKPVPPEQIQKILSEMEVAPSAAT